jgi:hypothetical protein
LAAPVIWRGAEEVVTVPFDDFVYVGRTEVGAAVVEDVGGVTTATLAELLVVLTGIGVVDTLAGDEVMVSGAMDVKDDTPYKAAQSDSDVPFGQHQVPSLLSVQ